MDICSNQKITMKFIFFGIGDKYKVDCLAQWSKNPELKSLVLGI